MLSSEKREVKRKKTQMQQTQPVFQQTVVFRGNRKDKIVNSHEEKKLCDS